MTDSSSAFHHLSPQRVERILSTAPPLADQIRQDPEHREYTERGWEPVYSASSRSRIVVIGQAPGRTAQESRIPWNDPSGKKLRAWMGVTDEQFYNPDLISLLPMDFYYPGKGAHGDNPPRKDFAPKWHERLLAMMPGVRLILPVGAYSQKYYLNGVRGPKAQKNLTETVRACEDYLPRFLPLVHPSPLNFRWQAKNPWFEQQVVPALQERVAEILREV